MFTVEEAKEYVEDNLDDIRRGFDTHPEIPDYMRSSAHFYEVWKAGCWLNAMLKRMGADEETVLKISLCHGQRCAFSKMDGIWDWAVRYANEFADSGRVMDQPGNRLADRICEPVGIKTTTK